MAEDVNAAAGQTAESKLTDLREDAPDEAAELETLLEDLGKFCLSNGAAYFLLDTQDQSLTARINELQDLRFVHLLEEGVTLQSGPSRRHRLLLLDVAYVSSRRARGVDFEAWTRKGHERRRASLVYTAKAGEGRGAQAIKGRPPEPGADALPGFES